MKLLSQAILSCWFLVSSAVVRIAAEPGAPKLETDIEFAKINDVSLTLDAFVPEGKGPFPTCILVQTARRRGGHGTGTFCLGSGIQSNRSTDRDMLFLATP